MAFKRRYTDANTDSYALVTISGDATFTGILNGTYVDAVTGDVKTVTDGKLTATCSGKGNMRVYVLNGTGKIGDDGKYLFDTASVDQPWETWPDETMPDETWTEKPNGGGGGGGNVSGDREEPDPVVEPAMAEGEQAVFFEHDSWNPVTAWIWSSGANYTGGSWPGQNLTYLGNNVYKWTYTGSGKIPADAKVIFSNAGNNQVTKDGFAFVNGGYYNASGYVKTIEGAGEIPDNPIDPTDPTSYTIYFDNSQSNWGSVTTWIWDAAHGDKNYTGGNWPGKPMTLDPQSGYYTYSVTATDANPKMMVIFSNNGGSQTKDMELHHRGIYNADGFTGSHVTGIEQVTVSDIRIGVRDGRLMVETPDACTLGIARVDGMTFTVDLHVGLNSVELPRGMYIVNGKKILL